MCFAADSPNSSKKYLGAYAKSIPNPGNRPLAEFAPAGQHLRQVALADANLPGQPAYGQLICRDEMSHHRRRRRCPWFDFKLCRPLELIDEISQHLQIIQHGAIARPLVQHRHLSKNLYRVSVLLPIFQRAKRMLPDEIEIGVFDVR